MAGKNILNISKFVFVDYRDETETEIFAQSFDTALLIFVNQFSCCFEYEKAESFWDDALDMFVYKVFGTSVG